MTGVAILRELTLPTKKMPGLDLLQLLLSLTGNNYFFYST